MNRMLRNFTLLLLAACLALPALAEEKADKKDGKKDEEKKPKTIAELTKDTKRVDGLFTLFRNNKTGETSMLIKKL